MKKNFKDNFFYLIILIFYFLIALLLGNTFINITKAVKTNKNLNTNVIVIDAGHGGEDGGAVSKDGVLEKDINLSIAKKLNEILISEGFRTIMTREEDKAMYSEKSRNKTLKRKKVEDLNNRVKIANSSSNNILISIHQNKFTNQDYSGAQIFYSKNNKNSKILADFLKVSFKENLQPNNERESKNAGNSIYLLKHAKTPAVIVECGFLSNKEELEKLTTDEYQYNVAMCIYEGLKNFLESQKMNNI